MIATIAMSAMYQIFRMNDILEWLTKTLPEIASKFSFPSLRCKLVYLLHFLIPLRKCAKNSIRKLILPHRVFIGVLMKTLPEIASKFAFASLHCKLYLYWSGYEKYFGISKKMYGSCSLDKTK